MCAYMIVEPTNRKPRRRRSADSASDAGVVTGMSPALAVRGSRAGGGGTIVARYASNDPNSPATSRKCRAFRMVDVDLRAVADDPGIGHEPLAVGVVEGGHDRGIEAAERVPEGRPLVEDRRPREPGLERFEGQALEVLDGPGDRPAPLVVVIRDHHRIGSRAVRTGPRTAWRSGSRRSWVQPDQGTGASAKSVLRRSGSELALAALKTERKTSPETFFVPAVPMSVTLR